MIIDVAAYRGGTRCEDVVSLDRALEVSGDDDGFVWLGLYEPTADEFEVACRRFDLHELAVEDAIKAHQRPKLEVYGDTLSMVLRTARYLDAEEEVEFGEIFLFVGVGFIVAVRHGEASALGHVRAALEARPDRLACGPSAVLHAIVDHVVDDYLPVLEGHRQRHRGGRGAGVLPRGHQPGRADLQPEAGGARLPPGHRAPRRSRRSPGRGQGAERARARSAPTSATCTTTSCGSPSGSWSTGTCSTASWRPT